jgi:hypothetical protein
MDEADDELTRRHKYLTSIQSVLKLVGDRHQVLHILGVVLYSFFQRGKMIPQILNGFPEQSSLCMDVMQNLFH